MKVIHKFPLRQVEVQEILVPKDAVILTVQVQRGILCLWVLLDFDPDAKRTTWNTVFRKIVIVGTGEEFLEEGLKYIGTFQLHDGSLVFHVFEHAEGK